MIEDVVKFTKKCTVNEEIPQVYNQIRWKDGICRCTFNGDCHIFAYSIKEDSRTAR